LDEGHCTQKAQEETQEAQKVELKTEKLSCAFVPFVVYKIKIKQEAGLLPSPVEKSSRWI
jgi:hypothetical protein